MRMMRTPFGSIPQLINENLTLFSNAMEQFAGREELIGVRSRGPSNRPFAKVDALEAKALAKWQKKQEELARKLAEENKPKYISKTAEFSFRRALDPNITKRIYEIVKGTIEYYGKQDVYIRIKASVPDNTTVRLEFLEVPESESELVVNIIKVIGKSDLGVVKATLD